MRIIAPLRAKSKCENAIIKHIYEDDYDDNDNDYNNDDDNDGYNDCYNDNNVYDNGFVNDADPHHEPHSWKIRTLVSFGDRKIIHVDQITYLKGNISLIP